METREETIAAALGCSTFHSMGNDRMCKAGAIRMGISTHRAKPWRCRGRRLCSLGYNHHYTVSSISAVSTIKTSRAIV